MAYNTVVDSGRRTSSGAIIWKSATSSTPPTSTPVSNSQSSSSTSSIDYSQYQSREPSQVDYSQYQSREPSQIDYSTYQSRVVEGSPQVQTPKPVSIRKSTNYPQYQPESQRITEGVDYSQYQSKSFNTPVNYSDINTELLRAKQQSKIQTPRGTRPQSKNSYKNELFDDITRRQNEANEQLEIQIPREINPQSKNSYKNELFADITRRQNEAKPRVLQEVASKSPIDYKSILIGSGVATQRTREQTIREGELSEGLAITYGTKKEGFTQNLGELRGKDTGSYTRAYNLAEADNIKAQEISDKERKKLNVAYLEKETPLLEKDIVDFDKKYESYFNEDDNKYHNLPDEGSKKLTALGIRIKIYNDMLEPIKAFNISEDVRQQQFADFNELKAVKGELLSTKIDEYKTVADKQFDNLYFSNVAKESDKNRLTLLGKDIDVISNQYDTTNPEKYKTRKINVDENDKNRYEKLMSNGLNYEKVPVFTGYNPFTWTGNFIENIDRQITSRNMDADKTQFGRYTSKKLEESYYAKLGLADDLRDKTLKQIDVYKADGKSPEYIQKYIVKQSRNEKKLRQAAGLSKWVAQNKAASLSATGMAFLAPEAAIAGIFSNKGINYFEGKFTQELISPEEQEIVYRKYDEKEIARTSKIIHAENEQTLSGRKVGLGFSGTWDNFIPAKAVSWIPAIGRFWTYDKDAIERGTKKGFGIKEEDNDTYSTYATDKYMKSRITGGLFGEGVGVILGEMAGESMGRRFTQSLSKKTIPKLIKSGNVKKAFWKSGSALAPRIAMAAPGEVGVSYISQQLGSYSEIKPSVIVGASIVASPLAGVIGGVIGGGSVAGRTVAKGKGSWYSKTGKIVAGIANTADIGEIPGDKWTDIVQAGATKIKVVTPNVISSASDTYEKYSPSVKNAIEKTKTNVKAKVSSAKDTTIDTFEKMMQSKKAEIQSPSRISDSKVRTVINTPSTTDTPVPIIEEYDEGFGGRRQTQTASDINIRENMYTETQTASDINVNTNVNTFSPTPVSISTPTPTPAYISSPINTPTLIDVSTNQREFIGINENIDTRENIDTKEDINVEENVNVNVYDGPAFIPWLPGLNMGKGGKTSGKGGTKKKGYQASFAAIALGITAKKKPTQQTFTGQEIRPIITDKKIKPDMPFGIFFKQPTKSKKSKKSKISKKMIW